MLVLLKSFALSHQIKLDWAAAMKSAAAADPGVFTAHPAMNISALCYWQR